MSHEWLSQFVFRSTEVTCKCSSSSRGLIWGIVKAEVSMSSNVIAATIIDWERLNRVEALIHDINTAHCYIVTDRAQALSPSIGVRIKDQTDLIKACITWRKQHLAGIKFIGETQEQPDNRKEMRYKVSVPVVVSDKDAGLSIRGMIRNASASGCGIEADNLDQLGDDILVWFKTLGMQVKGRIVWRRGNWAGIKLLWEFAKKPPIFEHMQKNELSAKVGDAALPLSSSWILHQ